MLNKRVAKSYLSNIKRGQLIDTEKYGINFRLNIQNNTTDRKILTTSKLYEKCELDFLSEVLHSSDNQTCFIDIGANTGYYSLILAKRGFHRLIAVEPNSVTLKLLTANIELNQWTEKIHVVSKAVGSGEKATLFSTNNLGTASLVTDSSGKKNGTEVDTVSLLDIVVAQKLSKVDALKIDIEGYEDQALMPFFNDAPKTLWPCRIVCENCHRKYWKEDLLGRLIELGYTVRMEKGANTLLELSK